MPPHHCWCTNCTYDGLGKYADAPDCTHVSSKRDTETRTKICKIDGGDGDDGGVFWGEFGNIIG